MENKEFRQLDGVYFRVERNNKFYNICFSDLTEEEKDNVLENRSEGWLKSLCKILGERIRHIGDVFDLIGGLNNEED